MFLCIKSQNNRVVVNLNDIELIDYTIMSPYLVIHTNRRRITIRCEYDDHKTIFLLDEELKKLESSLQTNKQPGVFLCPENVSLSVSELENVKTIQFDNRLDVWVDNFDELNQSNDH